MKGVLMIGSTGLLGSHLVKALQGKAEVVEASFSRAPHRVDIADPASLRRLFESVGPVDAIACTAGMVRLVPWTQASDGDWTTTASSPSTRCRAAIATTANAAVEGFARAAALELGTRIRVNVVSPGWITETLVALGKDPAPGVPAAEAALAYIQAMENGASGSVLSVPRQG
jgi:NAD(P)-dependent dehydrogenase (short-subunit alcohol dehydrogenase family)